MTPYLTRYALNGLSDRRNIAAWVTANLSRAKKMPKLETLLTKQVHDKASVGMALKQAMMQMGKSK